MVVIAQGGHLFPFRTEKLSLVAPMVLHNSGRVGRCHFTFSPVISFDDRTFILNLILLISTLFCY